jgi:alpha-tubulin suppressor-like RCC1 family protein
MFQITMPAQALTPQISASSWAGFTVRDANGVIWVVGNTTLNFSSQPAKLQSFADAKSVSLGQLTFWIIRSDDSLWGAGSNTYGELGIGNPGSNISSEPIKVLDGVRQVVQESSSTYAIRTDGSLWAWGRNDSGQLGFGDRVDRSVPTRVPGLANVVQVTGGATHALVLTADGKVWGMGSTCCLGTGVFAYPQDDPRSYQATPQLIPGMDNVVAIAGGNSATFMVRADGTLWVSGNNTAGQLGIGEVASTVGTPLRVQSLSGVAAVATAEGVFSLALLQDGTVWGWGANLSGQLGGVGLANESAPIKLTFLTDVIAIATGGVMSSGAGFALRRDGSIVSWGGNMDGSLGRGSIDTVMPPGLMAGPGGVGTFNAYAAAPASINRAPSINLRVTTSSDRVPASVTATVDASDSDGTIASIRLLATDGQSVSVSGASGSATFQFNSIGTYRVDAIAVDNQGGASIARGNPELFVRPPANAINTQAKIRAGFPAPIVLNSRGEIRTWGPIGQLGDDVGTRFAPNPVPLSLPYAYDPRISTVVEIEATISGRFAVLESGQVLAWGNNTYGALGLASGTWIFIPALVPGLSGIAQLAGGWSHSLARDTQGRVYATGANDYGQLGFGDRFARSRFTLLQAPAGIVQIAAGEYMSYALDSGGQVWAWGRNSSGQIGNGTTTDALAPQPVAGLPPIARIIGAGQGAFAIARDGTVWGWGAAYLLDTNGRPLPYLTPLPQPSLSGAIKIAAYGGAMLKADGTVWTWGPSLLGDGTIGYRGTPAMVPGLTNVVDVSTGNSALALRADGTAVAWGENDQGQLGDGTLARRLTPVLVVNETIDGPLDLIPEVPNSIPQHLIPPFFLATYKSGELKSTSLYADLRGLTASGTLASEADFGKFAASYNVYVAANVPLMQSAYFQLDSGNNWSVLRWPMTEFLRGVALDSQNALVRAQILQNADLSSPQLVGTSLIVGYGTDPDEMLRSARYRTIFTVPSP